MIFDFRFSTCDRGTKGSRSARRSQSLNPKSQIPNPKFPSAFSLLEILAALTIVIVVAGVVLARLSQNTPPAKKSSCHAGKGNIELQVELWYRIKGYWPAANLSDIGANALYFPDGVPICPVDGTPYTLDPTTHRVTGHTH